MKVGEVVTKSDISVLRPCPEDALPPYQLNEIIGKRIQIEKQMGEH